MLKLIPILSFCILCLGGCDNYSDKAIIEDYIVGAPYEVLKVDGNKPERISSRGLITYVPFVYVDEGIHELVLVKHGEDMNSNETQAVVLQVEVSGGKRYRIFEINDEPVIQEIHPNDD